MNAENRGYLYDPAWNLNKRTNNVTVATFTVNNLNQLTSGGSVYDSNGNMTTGSSMTFAYDDDHDSRSERFLTGNQFVAGLGSHYQLVEAISGSERVVYTYDGKMRLRKRSYFTWNGSSWYPGAETFYIYDGMLMVQERGAATITYTRGLDLSGTLQGVGGIGGLLGRSQGANHYHYHSDGNGNITFLAYSTQTIAASYKYDPYGNIISSSGGLATSNPFRFSSKLIDTTTGLYYYGYRWYSPSLQRWLNRDPLGEVADLNLYRFTFNDPFNFYDTDGRIVPFVLGGIAIGAGVYALANWGLGLYDNYLNSQLAEQENCNLDTLMDSDPNDYDPDAMRRCRINLVCLGAGSARNLADTPGVFHNGPPDFVDPASAQHADAAANLTGRPGYQRVGGHVRGNGNYVAPYYRREAGSTMPAPNNNLYPRGN